MKPKFSSNGQIALVILIVAIVFGALLLVSGGPAFYLSTPNSAPVGEPAPQNPGTSQDNLQLGNLKFQDCTSELNIDLLLDRTGSMNDPTQSGVKKIDALKIAVKALVAGLNDNSIIGIQSFDSNSITNDVPISYYKDVKSQIGPAIDALTPGNQTPTHDALAFSYSKLQAAKGTFPDKKISFIFITDGIPVPPSQDPRLFNPNPADQIKTLGYTIYTIGIHAPGDVNNNFTPLLTSIASAPSDYFEAPTGDEIKNLLSQIEQKICSGSPTP